MPLRHTSPDAVLIFEGIFLHRPELSNYWDFSIFVHSDFKITKERAQKRERDINMFETPGKIRKMYTQRYIPGQQIYLNKESPSTKANAILNNNNINNPHLIMNK